MKPLLQAMKERRLYLDGGMGSMLQAAGLPEGLLPDVWGMQNPAAVQGVHRAYLEAGARLITTNTFGTSIPPAVRVRPMRLGAWSRSSTCRWAARSQSP